MPVYNVLFDPLSSLLYSMFGLELKQAGAVVVNFDIWSKRDNKWDYYFTVNVEASNSSLEIVGIVQVIGEYKNHGELRIATMNKLGVD